jgi:DNA-binding MarR family transcriptional regulator
MSGPVKTPALSDPLDLASDEARIGVAWRELRRGAAMQAMRHKLYGDLLDPGQVDALDVVIQHQGCRMAELADGLRVDPSSATRVVDRLVEGGLVERVAAHGDGRGVRVVPTPSGREIHERLALRRRTMLFSVLEGFGPADRARLAALLERLVEGIDRFVSSDGPPV